jgi:hypothetical protein
MTCDRESEKRNMNTVGTIIKGIIAKPSTIPDAELVVYD